MTTKNERDAHPLLALDESMSPAAVDAMEARLLEAFTAHHRPVGRRWRNWVAAAAVLALLAGALTAWRGQPGVAGPARPSSAPAPAPAAVTADRSPAAAVSSGERTLTTPRAGTGRTARPRPARPAPQPAAAAFVTLPGAIGLPRFESGSIVRVDLPLSSLAAYGIDISAAGRGPVATDVLVGQDGEARAIRLVSTSSLVSSR